MLSKLNPEAEIIEPSENMVLKKSYDFYDDKGWIEIKEEDIEN